MQQREIVEGLSELSSLAELEYRKTLTEIVAETDPARRVAMMGRLIGVMFKEPFATPVELTQASAFTGAYRGWHLRHEFMRDPARTGTWQYRAFAALKNESPDAAELSFEAFVSDLGYERGIFKNFAESLGKYVCGDKELTARIEKARKDAVASGVHLPKLTPESIVAAGGGGLGIYLINHVPILGYVGAPVIAGVVLILYSVGVDGFCRWIRESRETAGNEN